MAVSFIERDIKTYLIEADADNTKIIKRMWDNSLIKIIDKASAHLMELLTFG